MPVLLLYNTMAFKCDRCGKGIVIASQQRHKRGVAGERWKYRAQKSRKIMKPNLQTYRGELNGKQGKWKLCAKCLKLFKKKPPKKPIPKKTPAKKSA